MTSAAKEPVGGVSNDLRLAAVARAELHGHLGDQDLNSIVATLRIACRVPIAVINIVEENRQTYPAEVGVGAPCTTVPDDLSFCAEVVETNRTLAVSDATAHPVYANNPLVLAGVVAAYAGVPLVDAGYVLGSVSVFDGHARDFTPDELEILHHQARLASSVLALRRTARTDGLTGLPNRQALLDRLGPALARARRNSAMAAAMYLDLDGFKALNDTCGHDAGDRVLVDLATRWTAALRPPDTLARVGGDEFVVVCEDLTGVEDVIAIADRLIAAVHQSPVLSGQPRPLTLSIGITMLDSTVTDAPDVLQAADAAMYRAKATPGSAWVLLPRPVEAERPA